MRFLDYPGIRVRQDEIQVSSSAESLFRDDFRSYFQSRKPGEELLGSAEDGRRPSGGQESRNPGKELRSRFVERFGGPDGSYSEQGR